MVLGSVRHGAVGPQLLPKPWGPGGNPGENPGENLGEKTFWSGEKPGEKPVKQFFQK